MYYNTLLFQIFLSQSGLAAHETRALSERWPRSAQIITMIPDLDICDVGVSDFDCNHMNPVIISVQELVICCVFVYILFTSLFQRYISQYLTHLVRI